MINLFDVTDEDIALLNDSDLRILVGKLCIADYQAAGRSISGIRYGGRQDARDGGLDVVVDGEELPPTVSFIPRNFTGFQVKKPGMSATKILTEMRPKKILRERIKIAIQKKGAYIIVCSQSFTSDSAYIERLDAMKKAVKDEDGHENLHLDFFDSNRIANWVNSHQSIVLWVRNKIGCPLTGWHPYENWVKTPGGVEEYLLDDGLRIHGVGFSYEGVPIGQGLLKLRSILSVVGESV
jgi:hypothetical protein